MIFTTKKPSVADIIPIEDHKKTDVLLHQVHDAVHINIPPEKLYSFLRSYCRVHRLRSEFTVSVLRNLQNVLKPTSLICSDVDAFQKEAQGQVRSLWNNKTLIVIN